MSDWKNSWKDAEKNPPPIAVEIIVVKIYLNHMFEDGGYNMAKYYYTDPFVTADICYRKNDWQHGGIVTHWMELPTLPTLEECPTSS